MTNEPKLCVPPDDAASDSLHWLTKGEDLERFEWICGQWWEDKGVITHIYTPAQLVENGYRYVGPWASVELCVPPDGTADMTFHRLRLNLSMECHAFWAAGRWRLKMAHEGYEPEEMTKMGYSYMHPYVPTWRVPCVPPVETDEGGSGV